MTRSDIIDIHVDLHAETGRAVLVSDGGEPVWLPKSQVEIESSDDGRTHVVSIPEWLAQEKELI